MAERDEQLQTEREDRPRRRRPLLRMLVILLLVLAVVAAALLLDGAGFDRLRRLWSYGGEDEGVSRYLTYDADSSNQYALLDDSLLVLSSTNVTLLSNSGEELYRENRSFENPAIATGGSTAAVYSVGGGEVLILDAGGLRRTLSDHSGIVSVHVNASDYVAVVSGQSGYKNVVSVYDEKGNRTFDYHSSSRYILNACVARDNKYVAMAAMGQENGSFITQMLLYQISTARQAGSCTIPNGLALAMGSLGKNIVTVTDSSLCLAQTDGELLSLSSFDTQYLREYSLTGDGFCALLLGRYKSGSQARLVTYGADGEVIASLELRDEVKDLSARGKYLAVLYGDRLVIYSSDLQEYSVCSGLEYARGVEMKSDGSALLLGSSEAWLYLP